MPILHYCAIKRFDVVEPTRLLINYKIGQKSTHQNTQVTKCKFGYALKIIAAVDWQMFVVVYLFAEQVLRNGTAEFVELVVVELHL